MDKNSVCKLPVDALLRLQGKVTFDVYVRLSQDKVVKLSRGEDLHDILPKYKAKGVDFVYVIKEEYTRYLEQLKGNLSKKFCSPQTTVDEKMEILNDAYKATRESLIKVGLNPAALSVAEEISKKSLELVQVSSNIYQLFTQFKDKCDEQLLKKMMVSYVTTLIISTFDWQTSTIKEKAALSCILSDITLEPEDFMELDANKTQPAELKEKILNHPLEVAALLQDKVHQVSKETIIMIEQHHEEPDGSGFPRGLRHSSITLLSAIQIVSEHYVELLFSYNFDHKMHKEILGRVLSRYNQGNFRKTSQALGKMFGIETHGL